MRSPPHITDGSLHLKKQTVSMKKPAVTSDGGLSPGSARSKKRPPSPSLHHRHPKSPKRDTSPPTTNVENGKLDAEQLNLTSLLPFDHQVAGHQDALFKVDDHTLAKATTDVEARFYRDAVGTALERFMPQLRGFGQHKDLVRKPKTIDASQEEDNTVTVLMENVLVGFVGPCIADVKIGKRLYGDDASKRNGKG
ncbi:hypothetical protein BC829DRAFT_9774 [Chytridium lagenaria]|nr:hypothetical protein BC829DRAFT_9774 [Chytridium lagenaria]